MTIKNGGDVISVFDDDAGTAIATTDTNGALLLPLLQLLLRLLLLMMMTLMMMMMITCVLIPKSTLTKRLEEQDGLLISWLSVEHYGSFRDSCTMICQQVSKSILCTLNACLSVSADVSIWINALAHTR